MKTQKMILVLMAVTLVLCVTGCFENNRQEAAQLRWQNTIDQARLEAAQASIEHGQLAYAQKVLEDVKSDSDCADDARQMLSELKFASTQLALVRNNSVEGQAL